MSLSMRRIVTSYLNTYNIHVHIRHMRETARRTQRSAQKNWYRVCPISNNAYHNLQTQSGRLTHEVGLPSSDNGSCAHDMQLCVWLSAKLYIDECEISISTALWLVGVVGFVVSRWANVSM